MGKSISINKLCRCCMSSKDNANSVCPVCGFDKEWYSAPREHLRLDFILASRYMVGTSLAEDDYEISYIGWDLSSNKKVLIKEYYPKGLVMREKSDEVAVLLEDRILAFEERVNQYLYMAESISKFNNIGSLARVVDFFSENHTAYMITEYPDGVTAEKYLERCGGRMELDDVLEMSKTVMNAMSRVHEVGIIHDEITPYNILVTNEGDIKLLGLSPVVVFKKREDIGPWTDTYDICKTMYRLLTGQYPSRSSEDSRGRGYTGSVEINRPTLLGVNISPEIEEVLMKGLSLYPKDRYKSISELYEALFNVSQKGFSTNDRRMSGVFMQQENQTVAYSNMGYQNQLKDGQSDMNNMNNMNNMNGQPRMGQGQPRMNPNGMNGQPRMNAAGMNGQPRINPGQVNGQPRMNTTQININQRPNQVPPQQVPPNMPQAQVNQNTQRINPANNQMQNARPKAPQMPPNMPQRGPAMGPGMVQNQNNGPSPNGIMNGAQAPNTPKGGVPRPGVPQQQAARPTFPTPQAPQQQVVMRPGAQGNDPMGMMHADNNRRMPVPLNRGNRPGINLGQGEGKMNPSTTKIVTFVVCALIVGVTIFSVIKLGSGNNDNNSKANNNDTTMSANTNANNTNNTNNSNNANTNAGETKEDVAVELPPIEVYDIDWKSSAVEEYARAQTGIAEGAISTSDLESITDIRLNGKDIEVVDDFVHFQRLKVLNLSNNSITDLSPLANMVCLEELNLAQNNLSSVDLAPLGQIDTLRKVDMTNTRKSDFSGLENVPLVIGRSCEVIVDFYYTRTNADYTGWNLWAWTTGDGQQYDFEPGDGYASTQFTVTTTKDSIGFVIRRGAWEEKELDSDRFINLTSNNGTVYVTVRVNQGQSDFECICE